MSVSIKHCTIFLFQLQEIVVFFSVNIKSHELCVTLIVASVVGYLVDMMKWSRLNTIEIIVSQLVTDIGEYIINMERLDKSINPSFRYLDGVLSLGNYQSGDYLHILFSNELKV